MMYKVIQYVVLLVEVNFHEHPSECATFNEKGVLAEQQKLFE